MDEQKQADAQQQSAELQVSKAWNLFKGMSRPPAHTCRTPAVAAARRFARSARFSFCTVVGRTSKSASTFIASTCSSIPSATVALCRLAARCTGCASLVGPPGAPGKSQDESSGLRRFCAGALSLGRASCGFHTTCTRQQVHITRAGCPVWRCAMHLTQPLNDGRASATFLYSLCDGCWSEICCLGP